MSAPPPVRGEPALGLMAVTGGRGPTCDITCLLSYSCFSANTMEQIIENLQRDGSPFALEQLKVKRGSLCPERGGLSGQEPPGSQVSVVVA